MCNPQEPSYHDPSFSTPEKIMHAMMHLSRLQFQLMQSIQETQGLYPGQPQLLLHLRKMEERQSSPPNQRELARHLRIRPATLTVTIGRMESAGFLSRTQDAADARVMRVQLTQKGRDAVAAFLQQSEKAAREVFGPLGEEKMGEILNCLDLLIHQLRQAGGRQ